MGVQPNDQGMDLGVGAYHRELWNHGRHCSQQSSGDLNDELTWVDSKGKFWFFGGGNELHYSTGGESNDLWRYDPAIHQWTWMGGANTQDSKGIYGAQGVAASSNYPGARTNFAGNVDLAIRN